MHSSDDSVGKGSLLLAPPMSADPNFYRTVVLVCEHDDAEGSFGLILNRPLELLLTDVLDEENTPARQICLGGPVQQNTLHYLHRLGEDVENSIVVVDDIYWGGDFEQLKDVLRSGAVREEDVRLFLGYAGWSPGQLEEEIAADGWIVTPANADLVFSSDASRLWRAVLRTMGGQFAAMANFPDDPRLN